MTRILLLLLLAHIVSAADSPRAATTAADAEQQIAAGLRFLQASDSSPRQSVAAALSFTAALGFYKAQSDTDKVCELQANLYWCKKRMTLDDIQAFLAAKGQDEGLTQLASQMTTATEATVPPEESAVYFARAEKYAQQHPMDYFQVAIRYFEVADRFQGTSVSLTAQRKSLDAQRQANQSAATVERIARDLPAAMAVAGDLPASAAKIINDLNAIITTAAKSAAADIAKEEKRVVDSLTKEAESEQKKGNLDGTIAIQKQISNLENDQPGLTKSAQAAVDSYRSAKGRVIDRTQAAIGKEQAKTLKSLDVAQVDETKKGNVPGALAIKTKRNELADALAARTSQIKSVTGTNPAQIPGKWSVEKPGWSSVITLNKDGSASSSGGDSGTWDVRNNVIRIQWKNINGWEEIHLDGSPGDSWTGKSTVTGRRLSD